LTHNNKNLKIRAIREAYPERSRIDPLFKIGKIFRQFSIKTDDTSEQKSNFSKIFNSLSQNELRATSDEKRLYFRIKRAATSNCRGSVFLLSGKKQLIIYVPIRPSQPRRPSQLTNVADPPSYGGNHEP
jgi:hypothetical protein